MKAELAGIGRRGEVAGEESDYDRNPATEVPSPRGYINKVSALD
jgi:hypothetical protein